MLQLLQTILQTTPFVFFILILVLCGTSPSSNMPKRSRKEEDNLEKATLAFAIPSLIVSIPIFISIFGFIITNVILIITKLIGMFNINIQQKHEQIIKMINKNLPQQLPIQTQPTMIIWSFILLIPVLGFLVFLASLPIVFIHNLKNGQYKKKNIRKVLIVGSWLGLFSPVIIIFSLIFTFLLFLIVNSLNISSKQ